MVPIRPCRPLVVGSRLVLLATGAEAAQQVSRPLMLGDEVRITAPVTGRRRSSIPCRRGIRADRSGFQAASCSAHGLPGRADLTDVLCDARHGMAPVA
jgi:hypothetical protein